VSASEMMILEEELAELRSEVEKLRGERDHFREAWAAAQVRLDCGVDAAQAVREDRAALIRWLGFPPQTYLDGYLLVGSIERGEHRREGDK
jgi:hypothetical protein